MTGEDTRSRLTVRVAAAADELCRYPFSVWHYGDSIGFEGLLAASRALDDPRYESFVYGALKGWIPRSEPFCELDNTAPGHAMCLCFERCGDERLLATAQRLADFLTSRPTLEGCYWSFARAPLRDPFGTTPLPDSERALLEDPGPGVFVDCLHFDAPFLTHLGRITGRADLVEAGVQQASAMVRLLQDESGLFHHFALARTGKRYGLGWSRGQGWALLGLLDVLTYLPAEHVAPDPLREAALRLATALISTQHASGHWPGLVQEEATFLETSAAFFFAAGLAKGVQLRLFPPGWLANARRAFEAGLATVAEDGTIRGVSAAVWACTSLAHYRAVPVGFQVPWGQGPFLVAADSMEAALGVD